MSANVSTEDTSQIKNVATLTNALPVADAVDNLIELECLIAFEDYKNIYDCSNLNKSKISLYSNLV